MGFEDPGWQGAKWAPVEGLCSPRPVWIVEGEPKDPYYNFGKIVFYMDKEAKNLWFKMLYDRAGEYWKTLLAVNAFHVSPSGETSIGYLDYYIMVDDKTKHSTHCPLPKKTFAGYPQRIRCPYSLVNGDLFTTSAMVQLGK